MKIRFAVLLVLVFFTVQCGIKMTHLEEIISENDASVNVDEDVVYKIAFNVMVDQENYNYDVFTMNPDGTGKRNITHS